MGAIDPRTPCLIGVGQRTWRPGDAADAPEPIAMWEEVARLAAADSGARGDVLAQLDSVQVVYCHGWTYDDPPSRLAERIGASPRHQHYSGIAGTTGQQLVASAATSMLAGECELALIVGGEALATKRRLKKAGERPQWSFRELERKPFPLEAPFIATEIAHEVFQAWLTFPMWDVARRAALGVAPEDYRRQVAELMAPMSRVAAANPHAWFPQARSAEELCEVTGENRLIGYPYTKYEVAIMDVDQAAALIVATHGAADRLGVPADRRVYPRGWCYGTDPWYLAEHHDYTQSPAMRASAHAALGAAGVGIDEVAHLDLYSCFAASVHFALDALGLDATDDRGVTVTGGLPFAGGPGSNYMGHSIATMVDRLRNDPGSHGLVSGVGMHMTKHAYGVYSTEPAPVRVPDEQALQAELDAAGKRVIRANYIGPATIATYTVAHGRDGSPDWGLAICDLPEGDRCYARVQDTDLLAELERTEWVGAGIEVIDGGNDVNLVKA